MSDFYNKAVSILMKHIPMPDDLTDCPYLFAHGDLYYGAAGEGTNANLWEGGGYSLEYTHVIAETDEALLVQGRDCFGETCCVILNKSKGIEDV